MLQHCLFASLTATITAFGACRMCIIAKKVLQFATKQSSNNGGPYIDKIRLSFIQKKKKKKIRLS